MSQKKESIVGRSPSGQPAVSFDSEASLRRWIEKNEGRDYRLRFYRQVITEEEITL